MTDVTSRLLSSLADRYRIERELGQGGMAIVYLAQDLRHDRKVALKVLRPELAAILGGERFLHEIRTTANLQHPHILPLHDSGEVEGIVYYVMPFVDGESLRDRLNREKQLPVDGAVTIAREVADALAYAHEKGIVHRDIKPENILLHGGHAMVADFGIALAVSTVGGGTRMTETGMSLGTPHYMAPEQAMGDREITARADIYALGCVTYEMLTGDPPFTGSTAQAIVARVVTETPRSLTSQRHTIAPHVEAVVLKALEKLPADRFASAREFADALQNPALTTPRQSSIPGHRPSPAGRRLMPLAVAAGVVVVAAVGWFRPPPNSRPGVVRFAIAPPREGAVRPGGLALSRDGRVLVYSGFDSLRLQRLYVRYAEREEPVMVRVDGVANAPFLSPDGGRLGMLLNGRIAWVPIEGGVPTTITDLPDRAGGAFSGASWGTDSTIVYSVQGSLHRVRVDGSEPETLLARDSSPDAKRFISPSFSSDGRAIILAVADPPGAANEPRVGVLSLRDRRLRVLNIQGRSPRVANGYLLYGDAAGSIHAVPFDERRLEPLGPPVPIVERAAVNPVATLFTASQSGAVAYVGQGGGEGRDLMMADRSGRVQALPVPAMGWRHPRFSPDGRRLVVGSEFRGSRGDLWVYDFASRRLLRLTFDSANVHPVWTPDGEAILFAALRGQRNQLYRVRADGSGRAESLLARARPIWEAEYAPDGRTIMFREDQGVNDRNVFMMRNDSVFDVLTSPLDERSIAISPDGEWFAFVSNASGSSGVYLRRLTAGGGQWPVSAGPGVEPRWARHGRELFYRNGDTLFTVPVRLGANPQIGQPRTVTTGRYEGSIYHAYYDVAPDGRSFVFVRSRSEAGSMRVHVALNLIPPR